MRDRTEQLYYSCRWQEVKSYLRNFGEFYSNQIEHAATIVLSRTQSMTDEKLKEAVHLIREENPDASIITTPWDKLDGEVIRKAVEQTSKPTDLLKKACLHQEHYHHGDGCCHHGIITMRSAAITVIMKTDAVMDITMTMRDITMRMRYSQAGH